MRLVLHSMGSCWRQHRTTSSNFLKEGYNVVVNGYNDESAWTNTQKHIILTHKLLLLPHLNTVAQRDAGRKEDVRTGDKAVLIDKDGNKIKTLKLKQSLGNHQTDFDI